MESFHIMNYKYKYLICRRDKILDKIFIIHQLVEVNNKILQLIIDQLVGLDADNKVLDLQYKQELIVILRWYL